MQCFNRYHFYPTLILILVTIIVQVSCYDVEKKEDLHNIEKRQSPDFGGPRGPPRHHYGGGPPRNDIDDFRRPDEYRGENRRAQPLSLSPSINQRGGGSMPGPGLSLGLLNTPILSIGVGGGSTVGGGGNPGFQNSPLLGGQGGSRPASSMGGFINMPNLGGFGSPSSNAANFGFQAAQNAANINMGQSPGLINFGNQNPPQNGNYDNRPNRGPQGLEGPGFNNSPNNQGGREPGGNFPGPQGNGQPSGGQQDNGRPSGQQNGRPNEETQEYSLNNNGRPNNGGGNGQQSNSPNRGGGNGNSNSSGNQGNSSGKKKCRGNQYTCQNRECVARDARCNGVNDCRDGSDEDNCQSSNNRPAGQGSSVDHSTTAAPLHEPTNEGCILPEQPVGGSFELGSCQQPCNMSPGRRVPLTSFLTYRCDQGYTLNGNNVSFCHNGEWYLPPNCVKTCPPLKSNSVDIVCKLNGEIVSCESAIAPETKATLACKHSYKIPLTEDPAYRELTCLEEGIWDRTLFRCLPECGTAVAHGNTLIVNGFTAKLGVFPWHCGIYERNSAGNFDQICAGTLISPDLVVSAAHCFYDDTINEVQDSSKYAVGAGKHYRLYNMPEKYAQKSFVKTIEVASRYYGASGNFAEDIALVRLQTPFTLTTLVRPVCVDWDNARERDQLHSGQVGKAVGWGKTAEGVPSNELQEINLPFVSYQECISAVPEEFKGYVTADKFCAGYLNGSSLCEGDSGGGLCFQLSGIWYLRGIVSVSPVSENTCDNNYYTAFTNVGRFREWIRAAYISST